MEETLISFETAKSAKDREFDLECKYRYYKVYAGSTLNKVGHNVGDFVLSTINKNDNSLGVASLAEAPTQALLQRWLREVYNIHLMVEPYYNEEKLLVYGFDLITERAEEETIIEKGFKTYEEALEIGLQEALKLIKNS